MGFYIRKSISVGPLRFNLSKSGIGVSAGIKGFRVGSGPRGNYVHMGIGGLHYRKTLPSAPNKNVKENNRTPVKFLEEDFLNDGQAQLKKIESAHFSEMIDSSSEDLVAELNIKRKKITIWPFVAIIGALISFFIYNKTNKENLFIIFLGISMVITVIAVVIDNLRKTTVIFFDFEPEIETLYQNLHDAFNKISSTSKKWHVEAQGMTLDQKRNAGATSLVQRKSISVGIGSPPNVKSNVPIPNIQVGKKTLYFFPDKVLIFEPDGVGAVSYQNLVISSHSTQFVETESVPNDAKIIGYTWKYVNKNGGPDKRFKDNHQIPIVLYEEIDFKSNTGLNERIQISKTGLGNELSSSIYILSSSFTKKQQLKRKIKNTNNLALE